MTVVHPKRPEWGPGEILAVSGDSVTVKFRDVPLAERPVKTINLSYVQLRVGEPAPATPYAVCFPKVIRFGLDYPHKLTTDNYQRVDVPDAREVVQWYFREMYLGVEYEHFVHGETNRSHPNTLTHQNFEYTRKIIGIGWSYDDVRDLIGRTFEELEQIPPDADIFETDAYDVHAIRLLTHLHDGYKGIKVANASKLLYQKRPRLIPILDDFVRRAMNVHWVNETHLAFELGFRRVREIAAYGHNREALDRTMAWLPDNPDVTGELSLSRLRVLDILAWGVIQKMDQVPWIPKLF